jgi:hypothetical protein
MAYCERLIFMIKFLLIYYWTKRYNLLLFIFYSLIVFVFQVLKVKYFYSLPFLVLSYYALSNLYNEDKEITDNKLYDVLGIGKLEVHSSKLSILFILLVFQNILIGHDSSFHIQFITILSLLNALILNINLFSLKYAWIKILVFFGVYILFKSIISSYGILLGIMIFSLCGVITYYHIMNEYNRCI